MLGEEAVGRLVEQALVLQEVAYPTIRFTATGAAAPLVCDRQQIGRVLTNVLKYAAEAVASRGDREAGHKGEIAVVIIDGADCVTITITDNGVGLPAEGRERLTEPYVTTRARGTGLVLAIVQKIVEDHGGRITVRSAVGQGTTFTVELPIACVE